MVTEAYTHVCVYMHDQRADEANAAYFSVTRRKGHLLSDE
jgi:hypothetical protein